VIAVADTGRAWLDFTSAASDLKSYRLRREQRLRRKRTQVLD